MMSGNVAEKRLTPKQARAVATLLDGATYGDAAAASGVNPKTLERWRLQPHFDRELRQRSTQAVTGATRRLTGTLDRAVTVMRSIMDDENEPAAVRLRAANYVMTHALKLIEVSEVLERLERLEARVTT